jgi:hypothetical protein
VSRLVRWSLARFRLLLVALATVLSTGCTHTPARSLKIERLGGLAGFGAPGSRLRSQGEIDLATLPPADRQAIESLFASPPQAPPRPDELRYRLTRPGRQGPQSIEVPEDRLPESVRSAVKEEVSP